MIVSGHGAGQDEEAAHLPGLLLQRRVREYFRSGKFPAFYQIFPAMIMYYPYFSRRNFCILFFWNIIQNTVETLKTFFRGVYGDSDYLLFKKYSNLRSCFLITWRNPCQVLNTKK
jgi:hypothetical protein